MRKLLLALSLVLFASMVQASAADSSFLSTKGDRLAQGVNPDPFNVKPGPAPAPAPGPMVVPEIKPVFNFPAQGDSWMSILWAAIGAIATTLFGKVAIWGVPLQSGGTASTPTDHKTLEQIVTSVIHPDGDSGLDPALRAKIDGIALRVIQSGIPGMAIQTGAGFIPGAGGIVAKFEPMLRHLVEERLNQRLGTVADVGGPNPNPMPSTFPPGLLAGIEEIVKRVVSDRLPKPAG